MLGRLYEGQNCSAARALELVGERWTLLIVRDALFRGIGRFSEFQRSLGLARNVLTVRLERLVEEGLMERRTAAGSTYEEYVLTEKGRNLQPVIVALTHWGDRWAAPAGPPIIFEHEDCGGAVDLHATCTACGGAPTAGKIRARRGPGSVANAP